MIAIAADDPVELGLRFLVAAVHPLLDDHTASLEVMSVEERLNRGIPRRRVLAMRRVIAISQHHELRPGDLLVPFRHGQTPW